jgi:hypothetical protein
VASISGAIVIHSAEDIGVCVDDWSGEVDKVDAKILEVFLRSHKQSPTDKNAIDIEGISIAKMSADDFCCKSFSAKEISQNAGIPCVRTVRRRLVDLQATGRLVRDEDGGWHLAERGGACGWPGGEVDACDETDLEGVGGSA